MQKLAVVFFTLWSVSAFATVDLFSEVQTSEQKALFFNGSGFYYEKLEDGDVKGKYLVALTITSLDADRTHFSWHDVYSGGGDIGEEHFDLILLRDREFITVYAPANEDSRLDFSTYVEVGWGYIKPEDDANKQSILLNYLYTDGDRYDEHLFVTRDAAGRLNITTNGTLGIDTVGMSEFWHDLMHQMVE